MKKRIIDLYKSFSGNLEYALHRWKYPADELIVLCMHSTPADRMNQFNRLLDELLRHFKPLNPSLLEDYFDGKLKDGPYIMFTFDDGLSNNRYAAAELTKRNISAFFFLVPDFITAQDQKAYYRQNIRQIIDSTYDKLDEDFIAMSKTEIEALIVAHHEIGSHTMSHLMRCDSSAEMISREIRESGKTLHGWFGRRIKSFCSVIHTTISVNGEAKSLIDENYDFHFTTYPGKNADEKNPKLIFRRNIELNWSMGKIRFALGQWDLRRWKTQVAHYRHLLPAPTSQP